MVADTPQNWDSIRSGVWAVEHLIRAEVSGSPPPEGGTWGLVWIRRFLGMAATRANPGRLIGYTVGRRRMEGLPDIDLWRDFVEGVEYGLVEEAIGEPTHWPNWDDYWLSDIRRLSQGLTKLLALELVRREADWTKPLDFACYVVLRRRQEGFPELKGVTVPCPAAFADRLDRSSALADRPGPESRTVQAHRADWERHESETARWVSADETFADPADRAVAKAAKAGDGPEIDRLLAGGKNPNGRGAGNLTPLLWAWRKLSAEQLLAVSMVRAPVVGVVAMPMRHFNLMEQGRAIEYLSYRPMAIVPWTKVPPGLAKMLQHGADPNVLSANGTGILHEAVALRWTALVRAALRHGADPNLPDERGERPLAWILAAGHPTDEDLRLVKTLLDAPGFEVEAPNDYGTTLAMRVAGVRDDILLELLKRGADYRARNGAGYSVLDRLSFAAPYHFPRRVAARQHKRVVRWLSRQGVALPAPTVPSATEI